MSRYSIIVLSLLAFHLIGMVVFVAYLDARTGCSAKWVDQPVHCSMYKGGAGLWEAVILYELSYRLLKS